LWVGSRPSQVRASIGRIVFGHRPDTSMRSVTRRAAREAAAGPAGERERVLVRQTAPP
jgi:hypothetical protein